MFSGHQAWLSALALCGTWQTVVKISHYWHLSTLWFRGRKTETEAITLNLSLSRCQAFRRLARTSEETQKGLQMCSQLWQWCCQRGSRINSRLRYQKRCLWLADSWFNCLHLFPRHYTCVWNGLFWLALDRFHLSSSWRPPAASLLKTRGLSTRAHGGKELVCFWRWAIRTDKVGSWQLVNRDIWIVLASSTSQGKPEIWHLVGMLCVLWIVVSPGIQPSQSLAELDRSIWATLGLLNLPVTLDTSLALRGKFTVKMTKVKLQILATSGTLSQVLRAALARGSHGCMFL